MWGFHKDNQCHISTHALQLVEDKQSVTVAGFVTAAASVCTTHTASASNSGVMTTSAAYVKSVKLFCEFGEEPNSQQPGGVLVLFNGCVVVTLLRSEQARPELTDVRPGAVDADD